MKVAIIIPTYNERKSIGTVLAELVRILSDAPKHDWHVVIVDGNSPDDTKSVVHSYQERHKNIHLLIEPEKRGIARAYLEGIRYAITKLNADAFVEFDGDGQHNPVDVLRLIDALSSGADYVIGSRYISSGSVPEGWALYRKLVSRFGSLYARLLLELPVHDTTSGLKATRIRGFAHTLPLQEEELLSPHYAYKLQFLQAMISAGARVVEIPIHFRERTQDISKSTIHDLFESFRVTALLRLRTLRHWRLLRVGTIGAVGFLIQATVFEMFGIQLAVVSASIAALIGGELAILSNFLLNERFSFRDRIPGAATWSNRLLRFHIVSSGSIATQWLLIFLTEQFTDEPMILRSVFAAGVALGFIINYTGYYFYVWGKKRLL